MGIRDLLLIAFGVLLIVVSFWVFLVSPRRSWQKVAALCLGAYGGYCIQKGVYD
jgi:hypothetical protein